MAAVPVVAAMVPAVAVVVAVEAAGVSHRLAKRVSKTQRQARLSRPLMLATHRTNHSR